MDSRYTNRERFLDAIDDETLAQWILKYIQESNKVCTVCPLCVIEDCINGIYHDCVKKTMKDKQTCLYKIKKWLGEKT